MNKINIQRLALPDSTAPGWLASSIKGMMINGKEVKGAQLNGKTVMSFPKWRTPELADSVGGKTMKFVYPSSAPLANYGYDKQGYNNNYIVTSGPYMLREIVYYDTIDQAEDSSWVVMKWSTCIELFNTGGGNYSQIIYQCDVQTKEVTNMETYERTLTVQSTKEITRLTTITLPSDFGNIISYGGTFLNVTPQVDGNDVEKRPYTLGNLSASDNIGYGITLFAQFPTNIDKTWFPSPPAYNPENGFCELGDEYTLFSVEYEYTAPGDEWPTSILYHYSAQMFANGDWLEENNYNFTPDGTYGFQISYSEGYMGGAAVCSKTYGSSTTGPWNTTVIIPSCGISIPFGNYLNTNSKLYPYVKKIIWQ